MEDKCEACGEPKSAGHRNSVPGSIHYKSCCIDNLAARVAELERTLKKIASYKSGGVIKPGTPEADRHEMIHLARAKVGRR